MTRRRPRVVILLFASAREALGRRTLDWPVSPDGVRADALVRALARTYPRLDLALRTSRFVHNGEYLHDLSTPIRPGDEFAVHPPYGGG